MKEKRLNMVLFAILTERFCIEPSVEGGCPINRSLICLSSTKQEGLPTSRLFVCRYERRYTAGEGSFPRKAEVLRGRAVMCFNQLYQQKRPNIRKMIETEFVTKKQCPLPDRTAFCCLMCLSCSCFSKRESFRLNFLGVSDGACSQLVGSRICFSLLQEA